MDEKEIAQKALEAMKDLSVEGNVAINELKTARGFFAIIKTASKVIPNLARLVEAHAKTLGPEFSGARKRDIVLEAIMLVIPVDNLPWWAPEWLVRRSIGKAIDLAVDELNKRLGKNW